MSFRAGFQLVYGVYRLSKLKGPIIAVFGGSGAYERGKYARMAYDLSKKCSQQHMSVITGGGPGIMEAANCGAYKVDGKKNTLGIGVRGVDEDFVNECAPVINVDYFFVRKWLLTRYAHAFILFPGGIGTMDEFFEVMNLTKLKKMQQVPVVLIGVDYWKGIVEWYQHAIDYEFVAITLQNTFIVTDDIDEALKVIIETKPKKG